MSYTEHSKSVKTDDVSKNIQPSPDTKKKRTMSLPRLHGTGSINDENLITDKKTDRSTSVPQLKGIASINDPNCGFKLIVRASDESLVDLDSVYSEQCYLDVEITGRILIGVWYRTNERRLYIRCVKAENLVTPIDGSIDPYVKTYLLPGIFKSNKRKTGIQNNTNKPSWNEILKVGHLKQSALPLY